MPTRPKLTDEVKKEVLRFLASGATMEIAAQKVSVSRRALYKAMDRDPRFKEKVNETRDSVDDLVEAALFRNAVAGNVTAQIFWLKNRRRRTWRDVYDHESTITLESLVADSFAGDSQDAMEIRRRKAETRVKNA